jgi:hypothetical protein
MDVVGNDREKALLRLEEKAELAFEAWSAGDMPDDLYNHRMHQIAEQKQRIIDDLKSLRKGSE